MEVTTNLKEQTKHDLSEGLIFSDPLGQSYDMLAQVGPREYRLISLNSGNRRDDTKWTRGVHCIEDVELHYARKCHGVANSCHLEF